MGPLYYLLELYSLELGLEDIFMWDTIKPKTEGNYKKRALKMFFQKGTIGDYLSQRLVLVENTHLN